MNPLLTIFIASTLKPLVELMAWCLLVDQQVGGEC